MDHNELEEVLKKRVETLKLMSSNPRLRIILLLLIFRKLSLSKLSDLMGRSKSTVSHHLKKLKALDILKVSRIDARGSIDAKVYELIPGFLDKYGLKLDFIDSLPEKEKKAIFHYGVVHDMHFFEVMKILYEQMVLYYDAINDISTRSKFKNFEEFHNLYFRTPVYYDYWFLSKEGKEEYKTIFRDFKEKMDALIKKEQKQSDNVKRPFFILHTLFPLEEIINYDSDNEEFLKFFEAFE